MTNNKRVVTSGKVKVDRWAVLNFVGLQERPNIVETFNYKSHAQNFASACNGKVVRLEGAVTYTLAK